MRIVRMAIEPNNSVLKVARGVELDWKADTRPLHQLIDSIPSDKSRACEPDGWLARLRTGRTRRRCRKRSLERAGTMKCVKDDKRSIQPPHLSKDLSRG